MSTRLFVPGTPTPKGSNRAILVQGRARLAEGGTNDQRRRMREFTKAISEAARLVHQGAPYDGPVAVHLRFVLARPPSHPKTRRTWADGHGVGDIDKQCRLVLDALTKVAFVDDCQVVSLASVKDWGSPTGVHITVTPAPPNADRPDAFAGWVITQAALPVP